MLKPCGHRLIVKQIKLEDTDKAYRAAKAAGIVFAETDERIRAEQSIDRGVVVAIGPTAFKDFGGEAWCEIGQKVAFAKYSGKIVEDPTDHEKYMILNDEDIVCVIED